MAEEPVPTDLVDYVRDTFAPPNDAIRTLTEAAQAAGMPVGWEISPDVGRLFQVFCRAVGARRVLEFGTFAGHSAWWFASALPDDGKVVSLELDPQYAARAQEQLARLGIGQKVDIRVGAAIDLLPELEADARSDGLFDIIFLDADKARYPEFLEWAPRVLRPGGMLLADNVLSSSSWNGQTLLDEASDDPRILSIREFNRRLAVHKHFTAIIIPMRAGIAAAVYTP